MNLVLKILADDETAEVTNFLNLMQRKVLNVDHTRAKRYVKHNEHNVEPSSLFLRGSGSTDIYHFLKIILSVYQKYCLINLMALKDLEFFHLDLQEYHE